MWGITAALPEGTWSLRTFDRRLVLARDICTSCRRTARDLMAFQLRSPPSCCFCCSNIASMAASGGNDHYPDFDKMTNYKSAAADDVFAEIDKAGSDVSSTMATRASVSNASGIDALGSVDGDELYDLD